MVKKQLTVGSFPWQGVPRVVHSSFGSTRVLRFRTRPTWQTQCTTRGNSSRHYAFKTWNVMRPGETFGKTSLSLFLYSPCYLFSISPSSLHLTYSHLNVCRVWAPLPAHNSQVKFTLPFHRTSTCTAKQTDLCQQCSRRKILRVYNKLLWIYTLFSSRYNQIVKGSYKKNQLLYIYLLCIRTLNKMMSAS